MRYALLLLFCGMAYGQCAMCFRNAEAQTRARAEALNSGIAIMLVPLAGGAGAIASLAYKRRGRRLVDHIPADLDERD